MRYLHVRERMCVFPTQRTFSFIALNVRGHWRVACKYTTKWRCISSQTYLSLLTTFVTDFRKSLPCLVLSTNACCKILRDQGCHNLALSCLLGENIFHQLLNTRIIKVLNIVPGGLLRRSKLTPVLNRTRTCCSVFSRLFQILL